MATRGTIIHRVTDYDYMELNWERTSYSLADNTSTISWTLYLVAESHGEIISESDRHYVNVSMDNWSNPTRTSISLGNNSRTRLHSGTNTIKHLADGTKSFRVVFGVTFDIVFGGTRIGYVYHEDTITLDKLSQYAQITGVSNARDDLSPTIHYDNYAGNNVTKLQACISSTGADDDIAGYRDIPKDATSYSFELTDTERLKLWMRADTNTSANVRFYIKTVINGETFWHYQSANVAIATAPPILDSVELTEGNEIVRDLTGGSRFVMGYSTINYKINAHAQKDSRIEEYTVTYGADSFNTQTGSFTRCDSTSLRITLVDARLFKMETRYPVPVINYPKVSCALSNMSLTAGGALRFTITGKHFNESFGAQFNHLELRYRYKADGDSNSSSWQPVTPSYDGYNYSIDVSVNGLDYLKPYTIEVSAADALTSATTSAPVNAKPVFDWSKTDFNFNVPVTIMGEAIVTPNDYVVESGSESMGSSIGTWYWYKWNSGRAECFGCRNFGNTGVTTAWGNLYRSAPLTQQLPDRLFINTPEIMNITLAQGGYGGWIARHESQAPDATHTGSFIVVRPASATINSAYISLHCIGRWK